MAIVPVAIEPQTAPSWFSQVKDMLGLVNELEIIIKKYPFKQTKRKKGVRTK